MGVRRAAAVAPAATARPDSGVATIARPVVTRAMAMAATATVTRMATANRIHVQQRNRATMTTGDRSNAITTTVAPRVRLVKTSRLRAVMLAMSNVERPATAVAVSDPAAVGADAGAVTATARVKRAATIPHRHPKPQAMASIIMSPTDPRRERRAAIPSATSRQSSVST
jgi:hypothetical protein